MSEAGVKRTGRRITRYRIKGTAGGVANRAFPLRERLVIGGSTDCDVRLEEDELTGPAVEIRVTPEGSVSIRSLNARVKSFLNGSPLTDAPIAAGDEIRIGRSRFVLQAPGLRPDRVLTGKAVRRRRPAWPWLLLVAAAAAAALAWQRGWISI